MSAHTDNVEVFRHDDRFDFARAASEAAYGQNMVYAVLVVDRGDRVEAHTVGISDGAAADLCTEAARELLRGEH